MLVYEIWLGLCLVEVLWYCWCGGESGFVCVYVLVDGVMYFYVVFDWYGG